MFTTITRPVLIPVQVPTSILDDEFDACVGGCGATVEISGNYCDGCFDEHCCTCCGRDLEGAEGCADCWEPRIIKPGENY